MQFSLIPDKPLTTTGVGALAMQDSGPDPSIIHWARTTARTFVVRAVGSFLTATAMLSVLAFFAAVPGGDKPKMFLTALSVVINAVAAIHYSWIAKIRGFEGSRWKLLNDSGKKFSPLAEWNAKDAIGTELMVDAIRHSDWAVTMPFLVFKLYALINSTESPIFDSVEAAAAVSVVMILLGAFARLGTDDLNPDHRPAIRWLGLAAYAVSLLCLVLLLIDLGVTGNNVTEGYLLRSFFYIWVGYPVVAFVGVAYRLWFPKHGVTETLSLFKDAGFGLLDCYSKGVFALWTCWTVFGQSLFAAPAAVPFVAS